MYAGTLGRGLDRAVSLRGHAPQQQVPFWQLMKFRWSYVHMPYLHMTVYTYAADAG